MGVDIAHYSARGSLYGGLSETSRGSNIPKEVLRDLNRMRKDSEKYSPMRALAIAAYLSQFRKSSFFRELLSFVGNEIIPHESVKATNFTDSCACKSARCTCPSHAGELTIEDLCDEEVSSFPVLMKHNPHNTPFNGYVPPRDKHNYKVDLEVSP